MDNKASRIDFAALDRACKTRLVLASLLRIVIVLSCSLVLYFLIPARGFNEDDPLAAWIRLAAVFLAFLVVLGFQMSVVVSASAPVARAIEAIAESVVCFVLLFALLYLSVSNSDPTMFSEHLDHIDALYFTATTFSTVGFGDIVPTASLSRGLVALQMVAGVGVLGLVAKVGFLAAKKGLSRPS